MRFLASVASHSLVCLFVCLFVCTILEFRTLQMHRDQSCATLYITFLKSGFPCLAFVFIDSCYFILNSEILLKYFSQITDQL